MKISGILGICLALLACYAEAKAVFAHFMVGNTASYNQALWETEMDLAKASRIDAFVLNIARNESMNTEQISNAFKAAAARGFKLFFSFDYAGRGPWKSDDVLALLRQYGTTDAYWRHNGLPLVSTFEGPERRDDWVGIKKAFNCFFVPDWSSLGAEPAMKLSNGVVDGLFNWAAWPNHNDWPKDTYIDASYQRALGNLPYMMPVSPWFYTNLPKYNKNWLWRGEMLWFDRWAQTLHVQPEWVQIISWNDYGESHYVGPIRGNASLIAIYEGKAPFDYVKGIEHGSWRAFLPYLIDLYKTGTAKMTQEGVMVWHRMQSKAAGCDDGGTTSFTATHLQPEGTWDVSMRDGVFFAAQLGSAGTAEVTVGSSVFKPDWRRSPYGGSDGIYVGFVHTSNTGAVKVDIRRNGAIVASVTSSRPIGGCQEGYYNFNPVVTIAWGASIAAKSPALNIKDSFCVQGTAVGEFGEICSKLCSKYDYCPLSACMCTRWGPSQTKDLVRGPPGYPAKGRDTNWSGLCAVACSYGYCPSDYCSMTKSPDIISTVSPFTPKSCTSGKANTALAVNQVALAEVCEFGCKHGYCPSHSCVCTSTDVLNVVDPNSYTGGKPDFDHDNLHVRLLCQFTCSYGVCPRPLCKNPLGPNGETIYIGSQVHTTPTAKCPSPPCVMVWPPTTLRSATTISVPPYTATLEVGAVQSGKFVATSTTITITVAAITTTVVPVSNYNVPRSGPSGGTIWLTPSVTFEPRTVTLTKPNGVVTTRAITLPPWPQIETWAASDSSSGGGATDAPATITYPEETSYPQTMVLPCSPNTHLVPEYLAVITLRCDAAKTTLNWDCPATTTIAIDEPTTVDFALGCTRWTGTSQEVPTMTAFPSGSEVQWIEQDGDDDGDDSTTSCRLWFFSTCILKIRGWRWKISISGPIVIIGPPPIKWPDNVSIKTPIPGPWPPVTVGRDGKITYPTVQPTNCETQSAEICSTSTFISTTVSGGTTRTVTSRVTSTCDTIRGCIVKDGNYDTTSTRGSSCDVALARRTDSPDAVVANLSSSDLSEDNSNNLMRRAQPDPGRDHVVIWPRHQSQGITLGNIKAWLLATDPGMPGRPTYGDYVQLTAEKATDTGLDRTMLFYVRNMKKCHLDQINDSIRAKKGVGLYVLFAYGVYDRNTNEIPVLPQPRIAGSTVAEKTRRKVLPFASVPYWEIPQISVPPGEKWLGLWDKPQHSMEYQLDDSFGAGQTIFVMDDEYTSSHLEFTATWPPGAKDEDKLNRPPIQSLPEFDWGTNEDDYSDPDHGTGVLSKITGWKLGLARRANIIYVPNRSKAPFVIVDPSTGLRKSEGELLEKYLEMWVRVYNKARDMIEKDATQRGKIIVSCSSGFRLPAPNEISRAAIYGNLALILKKLDELDVVIVISAHNSFSILKDDLSKMLPEAYSIDHLFGSGNQKGPMIKNIIVVGGVDAMGRIAKISPHHKSLVMAPSEEVFAAYTSGITSDKFTTGNSLAAPLVAGLVAYWRGLPNIKTEFGWADDLKKPANVKKLLQFMHRPIVGKNLVKGLDETKIAKPPNGYDANRLKPVPFIWLGVHRGKNCLQDPKAHPGCPQDRIEKLTLHGAGCQQSGSTPRDLFARAGAVCALRPGSSDGNGPGQGALDDPVTFASGPASPTSPRPREANFLGLADSDRFL